MPVTKNSVAVLVRKGALGGDGFWGWRVAEDEEFDEDAEKYYDRYLAEEKSFGEGKSVMIWSVVQDTEI